MICRQQIYAFALAGLVGVLGAGVGALATERYRAEEIRIAQPLPKSQPQQPSTQPAPNYPPPAVINPGDQPPKAVPQPTTLVVNAAAPAPPPEPPAFLTQVLDYLLKALLAAIGFTALVPAVPAIARWAAGLLIANQEQYRARLKEMIKTALIAGAADMPRTPDGSVPADRKPDLLQRVLNYMMMHGQDTLKYLGAKPDSGAATNAIVAHAESFLADPKFPVTVSRDISVDHSKDDMKQAFADFIREQGFGGQAGGALPKAS